MAGSVLTLIAVWAVAGGVAGFGCKSGGGPADAAASSFCGLTDIFQGGCGGTVSGTGTTPLGTPFAPTSVRVTVAETCPATGPEHHVSSIDLALGSGPDFARLTLNDQADAGTGAFLGSHEILAQFKSFSPCMTLTGGLTTTITSVTTDGTAEITSGDDPNAAAAAGAGTVSGTFTFSGAGQSGSGSFSSPYCAFAPCPMQN